MGTTTQLNQSVFNPAVNPAGDFTGTPIARYEHLAIAEQQAAASVPTPDTVYVSVINETFTPNVYKTIDRGLNWNGVYAGFQKGTTNVVGGWLDVEPFAAGPLVVGQYAGLGWGFGGAAHNLGSAPSNANVAAFTNEGVTCYFETVPRDRSEVALELVKQVEQADGFPGAVSTPHRRLP